MPASEARIKANQQNAKRSTGPKTAEGKEQSRRNALKHGLTGAGIVLPEGDAAEVKRRAIAFEKELEPTGEVGRAIVRRAALNSVRMERAADQQTVTQTERIRNVEAEFVAPEGASEEEAAKLRSEAVRRAMFDPSKEATLARKYEAAAERGFYRALKELRQVERQCKPVVPEEKAPSLDQLMASFSELDRFDDEFEALYPELKLPKPSRPLGMPNPAPKGAKIDVPMTIGRPR